MRLCDKEIKLRHTVGQVRHGTTWTGLLNRKDAKTQRFDTNFTNLHEC